MVKFLLKLIGQPMKEQYCQIEQCPLKMLNISMFYNNMMQRNQFFLIIGALKKFANIQFTIRTIIIYQVQ